MKSSKISLRNTSIGLWIKALPIPYSQDFATFETDEVYDQMGRFINLFRLPLKVRALTFRKAERNRLNSRKAGAGSASLDSPKK